MKRLQKQNPNTVEYWSTKKGVTSIPADSFKFRNIANHIGDDSHVVDLGCGDGRLCELIREVNKGGVVHGVDFVKYERSDKTQVEYHIADVTDTGLKNGFDYVISTETLEHLTKPQELIDEVYRLLKPAGKFILTTPYTNHIPSPEHMWEFVYEDVKTMLEKFSRSWVFPWSSGVTEVKNELGEVVYPRGHWDTIMGIAIK